MAFDQEFWDGYAAVYPTVCGLLSYQKAFRRLVEAGRLRSGSVVLDVGCGSGYLARALEELGGPYPRIIGLDGSAEMLELARKEPYTGDSTYMQVDLDAPVEEWGIDPALKIDRIVANNSLYAASDPPVLLAKAETLAARGCVLSLNTPLTRPDMLEVLSEEIELYEQLGGMNSRAERERLKNLFAPNRQIVGNQTFHYPDEPTLHGWVRDAGWEITHSEKVYAGQNGLVIARKGT